ncbi:hypothetical protein Tco_0663579 [Tanacetum coccineum]
MHSTVKVPNDLLVVNVKDLIAKVNRSLADMNELVWFLELCSSWKHHHHMLLLLPKGEKSAQVDASKPEPQKSPFDVSDDDQQDIPLNTTTAPTQEEPQSSGTLDDPNSLAMVVKSEVEPIEEPPYKKPKVMMDIPTPVLLNYNKPTVVDNIPFEQLSTQLFGSGHMTIKEVDLQLHETKRLSNLKAAKDKSKEGIISTKSGQVIRMPEAGILYYYGNFNLVFQQSRLDVVAAREIVQTLKESRCFNEQRQTNSSQIHCQGSQRLLEDILIIWDGYQLIGRLRTQGVLELKDMRREKERKKEWQEEMDNPGTTMEEYVQFETEKALRNNQVYYWKTAKHGKISWCLDTVDINILIFFETKFSAIAYDDALKSESDFSLNSQLVDNVNWENKTSFPKYDNEEYNFISERKALKKRF